MSWLLGAGHELFVAVLYPVVLNPLSPSQAITNMPYARRGRRAPRSGPRADCNSLPYDAILMRRRTARRGPLKCLEVVISKRLHCHSIEWSKLTVLPRRNEEGASSRSDHGKKEPEIHGAMRQCLEPFSACQHCTTPDRRCNGPCAGAVAANRPAAPTRIIVLHARPTLD